LSAEFDSHIKIDSGSEKSFGLVFAAVFAIIGLYPLISGHGFHVWALLLATALLLLAFAFPQILAIPNKVWFKFGILLGAILAPIVMALVYFVAVVPTGLITRLMGKDLLNKKIDKNAESYWLERKSPVGTMKDQF
jgi:hypothetical protein